MHDVHMHIYIVISNGGAPPCGGHLSACCLTGGLRILSMPEFHAKIYCFNDCHKISVVVDGKGD